MADSSLQRVLDGFLSDEAVPVDDDEDIVSVNIRMPRSEREQIFALADRVGVNRRKFSLRCA